MPVRNYFDTFTSAKTLFLAPHTTVSYNLLLAVSKRVLLVKIELQSDRPVSLLDNKHYNHYLKEHRMSDIQQLTAN
jgi:hypothetical protein